MAEHLILTPLNRMLTVCFAGKVDVPIGNWVVNFGFEFLILVVFLARGIQGGRGDGVFMLAMAKPTMAVKLGIKKF